MKQSAVIPVITPPNAPHDSKSGELIAVTTVFMAFAVRITGLRLSLRFFRKDLKWRMDDWAIILCGLTSRKWMVAHNFFLALLVSYIITAPIASSFACIPHVLFFRLQKLGRYKDQRHYFNQNNVVFLLSALHTAFDFGLLTVPLVVLVKMQMNLSKKIRLSILFSFGSLSCTRAVIRNIIRAPKQQDITCKPDSATRPNKAKPPIDESSDHAIEPTDQYLDFQKWVIVDMFFGITAA
ncbi:MAG: hypothetical protein Q9191_001183 [Dirinaria sp. TL-2023a]